MTILTAEGYRESLRRYRPRVFVDGEAVGSVADDPRLAPGIAAVGVTYDFATRPEHAEVMTAKQATSGKTVNRLAHINETNQDLLHKLEATRLVCRESACAQRYLTHDGLNALSAATRVADAKHAGSAGRHERFLAYLHRVQDDDLTLGIAMTDGKGDRSKRPGQQANRDAYVHITERRRDGVVNRGTKAIVTAAPYVHEFLVMPCRTMTSDEADFAVGCAVPVDAPGVTTVARPAGRPAGGLPSIRRRVSRQPGRCCDAGCDTPPPPV